MRKLSRREWVLVALVPVAVLLAVTANDRGEDEVAVVADSRAPREPGPAASPDSGGLDLTPLQRTESSGEPANLFAAKSWYVPPPPQAKAKPVPPPPPTAPPLPFTYLGRYQDGAAPPVILLVRGERILTVRAGDVIEQNYRVEGITGSTLTLTYLPLNIKQSLDVGSAG